MTERQEQLKELILGKLRRHFGKTLKDATQDQLYKAVAATVRDFITDRWADRNTKMEKQGAKRLFYLSAEFLMGRSLVNNMINLHLMEEYKEVLENLGLNLSELEEQERDAGLGNGGLGRLAACFLDSLSTLSLPVTGCTIRYEYGLFRQRILEGEQVEVDDNWLEAGYVWEIPRPEDQVEVKYGGEVEEQWTENGLRITQKNYYSVTAIPYDVPVIGYESEMPATLRMWSAKAKAGLDMNYFNRGEYSRAVQERELAEIISKVLYPEDNHEQGKQLRLKQFYFFTSATVQYIVNRHKAVYGDLHTLPERVAVQINDSHPALAIPELMRVLMDDEGLSWDEAYDITRRMFYYTNHTVMPEAMENWNVDMFRELLPRIYGIINEINERFCESLWQQYPGDWDKIGSMAIISYDEIRMANLCVALCGMVNGVSHIHGEIVKARLFRNFYVAFPEKFIEITNGVTQRRWLAKANWPLARLIADHIGAGFLKDYREMDKIKDLTENGQFLDDFMRVKRENKQRLAEYVKRTQGIEINADTVFDAHAKRLHEYKRQLLKALHILHLYFILKHNKDAHITPATFLFAAKASPGYARAKNIIRLILAVGDLVNNDPDTKDILKVVFLENYNVSCAELLIPAADVSEQLSTAGLEASGTGNMKFMMNGAVTIGTMDGANVEICERVGVENIFIFGAGVEEITQMERYGTYHPSGFYEQNADIRQALNCLIDGTLHVSGDAQFSDLYHSLLFGDSERADKYYVIYDFASYNQVYTKMMETYENREAWRRMAARNLAASGYFCADRAIAEYNDKIWHLMPIE
ncbi:MAG TPA: glycogen phosphorylase [Clostridiales bacterium]|nr:glycogen phosphorylase [Clostridiales bacterium]